MSEEKTPRQSGLDMLKALDAAAEMEPEKNRKVAYKHVYSALNSRYYQTRKDKQNRLMWAWNKEISEDKHISSKMAHGQTKYEVLRPLMMEWSAEDHAMGKRIEMINMVLDRVPEYQIKCFICFDSVRSSDLTVKQFALYLTEMERYWVEAGVHLSTSEDYYYAAMGYKKEQ